MTFNLADLLGGTVLLEYLDHLVQDTHCWVSLHTFTQILPYYCKAFSYNYKLIFSS